MKYRKDNIINLKNNKMTEIKNAYALVLGLPQDEDESKVVNQIQSLVNEQKTLTATLQTKETEIAALKNRLQTFEQAKITNLINQAIAAKKFGEDERATYTALAEKDFAGIEKIINKLPGVDHISNHLEKGTQSGDVWNNRMNEIRGDK
jgi:hypothetical protein